MSPPMQYIFVYGSLLDDANPYGAYLQQHAKLVSTGKMKGKLYDIGDYPGAVFDADSQTFVHGSVFSMSDSKAVLNLLDEYEGFGDTFELPNEFVRDMIIVETSEGAVKCWAYLYNWPIANYPGIASGQYRQKSV